MEKERKKKGVILRNLPISAVERPYRSRMLWVRWSGWDPGETWFSGIVPFCCGKNGFSELQILFGVALEDVNFCLWAQPVYSLEGETKVFLYHQNLATWIHFCCSFSELRIGLKWQVLNLCVGLWPHPLDDLWPIQGRKAHHFHFFFITNFITVMDWAVTYSSSNATGLTTSTQNAHGAYKEVVELKWVH